MWSLRPTNQFFIPLPALSPATDEKNVSVMPISSLIFSTYPHADQIDLPDLQIFFLLELLFAGQFG